MADKPIKPALSALFSDGENGRLMLAAACDGLEFQKTIPPAPALRPRDFADEVSEIFHKAKRAALADSR